MEKHKIKKKKTGMMKKKKVVELVVVAVEVEIAVEETKE